MAKLYNGKRLKIIKAIGLRFGFGYLPHYLSNPDTDRPRELMLWVGPYIFAWKLEVKGRVRRHWADPERLNSLLEARRSLTLDIREIYQYWWRTDRNTWESIRDRTYI